MLSITISIIKIDNSKVHSLFIEYQRPLVICVQKSHEQFLEPLVGGNAQGMQEHFQTQPLL